MSQDYEHESRPRSSLPVGVTKLPDKSSATTQKLVWNYLRERGLDPDLAAENGWYGSRWAGDCHARVVIPCTNTKGYVYWQARAIDPSVARRYQSPSYSSSDSLAIVWPSSAQLVGPSRVALVEGPMDALAAAECGVHGVATMGKQPTDEQLAHFLKLFHNYTIHIVPDRGDIEAGVQTMARLGTRYSKTASVDCPPAKDLAAMSVAARSNFFEF